MPIRLYRVAHWLWQQGVPVVPRLIKIFVRLVFSVILPPSARLGKGVLLSYQGLGTVIHRRTVISDFVTIGTCGSIGGRSGHEGVPVVKNCAMFGSGDKILGPFRVGQFASIGANAVVLSDVEDFGVAVGALARVFKVLCPAEVPNYFAFGVDKPSA